MRKYSYNLNIIIILCVFFSSESTFAQLGFCQGNSGDPIFTEDFGTGLTNTALPPGTTTYNFAGGGEPLDGLYTVSSNTNYFDWFDIQDHTPGDVNGRMLVVNSSFSAGEFYRTTISNLCENTSYEFSSWIVNLTPAGGFCGAGAIPVNVRFEIWDNSDTILLASGNTGNIGSSNTPLWQQFALAFQTTPAQTSIILKMINNGSGGCGNDLAIDDIVFKSCGDFISVTDPANNTSVSLCSSETPYSTILTATPDNSVFSNHFYQWQESPDNMTWTDIAGANNQNLVLTGITTTTYYRAKVAEYAANLNNNDCITFSTTYIITVNQLPTLPTLECWETATANNATCTWVITGTQPPPPTLECWETTTFNTTTCSWDILGVQPLPPTLECWEIATFNNTICNWEVTGTQPVEPTGLDCWESTSFNTTTCSWDILGVQPLPPTLECWEIATFNSTICNWEVTGTQPVEPTGLECWETTSFNTTNCSWDILGVQPPPPILECWEIATFNNTICNWDVSGTPLSLVIPTALEVCDDGVPDGLTSIDLTLKNVEITGGNPNYSVSYYLTQAESDLGLNPLPIPYTNIVNGQVVYVRVQDINTGCYDTTVLTLVVEQAPIANTPTPMEYCDADSDGFGVFTITDSATEITGGDPALTVSYHETMADADNNVNALGSPYNNIVEDQQTLYVRVESATIATDCATIVELILIVHPTPQIEDPTALEECDDVLSDGFAQFDLTSKDSEILDGLDPLQYLVSYYEVEANAESGMNSILIPTNYTNTTAFNQILWVRVEDTVNGCYKLTTLELIVNALPVLVQPTPLELCDDNNPGDEIEAFTLEDATLEMLNGQTGISFTYYETQLDADNGTTPITSPYMNTSNPQTVFVRATDDVTGCYVSTTATILLRVNPIPSPATPTDLEVCDLDNDGFEVFDLESRTLEIINGELDIAISYHETQSDADMDLNALVSPYTNVVMDEQVIYIRAENTVTGCFNTSESLIIRVLPSPEVPVDIDEYVICDTNIDGFAQFDLSVKDAEVLGAQVATDFILTYHVTLLDAESGSNPIVNVTNYTNVTNPQTLYIRLESILNGCVTTTGFFDIRVELPPEAIQPLPLELCDDAIADEITVFDLSVKDTEITGGQASWSVSYYETDADAQSEVNAVDSENYTNTSVNGLPANPQTLYVVVTDTDTGCVDYTTLTIRVLPNPTPSLDPSDIELCDDLNPGDMEEEFDLTVNEVYIINGEAGVTVTYYELEEDADLGLNAIVDPTAYTNTSTPQTIYVRVTNDITGCYTIVMFDIIVNPLADVIGVTDFILCELNTDGIDEFDLTSKDSEVLNGQDPTLFTVTYHESQVDADDLNNALVSPYTNLTNPQQIFVAITNNVTGCSISTPVFNLEVHEAAEATTPLMPFEECDDEMDDDGDPSNNSTQFDLTPVTDIADLDPTSVQSQVLDGQDPANYIVTYYETMSDADLGVNPLPFIYENIVNPQVIYVRVDNDTPGVALLNLDLGALTGALDFNVDGVFDTIDTDGDGVFDLIDVDGDTISDGFDLDMDGLIDFIDLDGDGIGDLVDLNNDGVVDNSFDSSSCYAIAPVTLVVHPRPVFDLEASYTLCVDINGTEILDVPVLDTELTTPAYAFEWSLNGTVIVGATEGSYVPTEGGTYSVVVTDTATGCSNMDLPVTTEVIESSPPTSIISEVTTDAFSELHIIEVTVTGPGEYEYSLDGGAWQDSNVFVNVLAGDHEVTVRDKKGCGLIKDTVTVMDYPKYFTPNGDAYNNTWNIKGFADQPSTKIYIFDRYGKLIKQISPSSAGWDGTYNGNPMPTSDYWFVVEYYDLKTGKQKEFKAHFTLKR